MSMISPLPAVQRYSADVRLTLHIGAASHRIAQVGPEFFILSEETVIPGTSGVVSIQIDETERRRVATWEASDSPRRMVKVTYAPMA
jgi:hypothetical protein